MLTNMFIKLLRGIWYGSQYFIYHHIYIPTWDFFDRLNPDRRRILSPTCQICGETRHREKYCPNAYILGFFDHGNNTVSATK